MACLPWHPLQSLPPLCSGCIEFTSGGRYVKANCSFRDYQRNVDECSTCGNCLATRKFMSNCTQLQVPPWYKGTNFSGAYRGIFQQQQDVFYAAPNPSNRMDFHTGKVPRDWNGVHFPPTRHISICHPTFESYLDGNLKVVRKEDKPYQISSVNEKLYQNVEEHPAKKFKLAVSSESDQDGKRGESEQLNSQKPASENNTDCPRASEIKSDNLSEGLCQRKIKEEIPSPQDAITNCCEPNRDKRCKDSTIAEHAVQVPATDSDRVTRKKQSVKNRRGVKNGNIKPYNTRMVTSRPRTYSSDYVVPDEDDWKNEKEPYENTAKGRHRSKLNRLLANEHERRRVAQLNNAYQDLRQLIPGYQCDTKLPKIKILKYAINYIAHLGDLLDD